MSIDRIVFMFAGTMVLVSLALAQFHSPNWLWLTAFVGFNLLQSAFTRFCPLAIMLRRLGVGSDASPEPRSCESRAQ
jgi:hypothetical protein